MSFVRYFDENKTLIQVSMDEMEVLITNENNRHRIAEYVYRRLYNRFLKIFDYKGREKAIYTINEERTQSNVYDREFKNGFIQLASCSLLVETFAAFLTGQNETPWGQGNNTFNKVFGYAREKDNPLKIFLNGQFYLKIRNNLKPIFIV